MLMSMIKYKSRNELIISAVFIPTAAVFLEVKGLLNLFRLLQNIFYIVLV